jgi:hypothetical protein
MRLQEEADLWAILEADDAAQRVNRSSDERRGLLRSDP